MTGSGYHPKFREVNSSNINNVGLPLMICCKICKKNKSQTQYSNKQLNDLKYKVYKFGRSVATGDTIRCRECTGVQTTELRCAFCEVKKSLNEFALNQRSKPDYARCIACQEDTEYFEPDERDYVTGYLGEEFNAERDSDSDESDTSNNYEMDINGDYLTETEGGISVPPSQSGRSTTSRSTTGSQSTGSGLKLTKNNLASLEGKNHNPSSYAASSHPESMTTSTVHSQSFKPERAYRPGIMYTAYDAGGVKHERERVPSKIDTEDLLSESLDRVMLNHRPREKDNNPRAFPRVRPENPKKPRRTKPTDQEVRITRLETDSDSDDDLLP